MSIEIVGYQYGSPTGMYGGRVELQMFADEHFTASYVHHEKTNRWEGRVAPGTFAKACDALSGAGFPIVPQVIERAPGQYPLVFSWFRNGTWERGETLESEMFSKFLILTSTVLALLDTELARMPPGETSPVLEQHSISS